MTDAVRRFWKLCSEYPIADPPVPEKSMLEAYMFFWPSWERPLREFAREDLSIALLGARFLPAIDRREPMFLTSWEGP